MARLPIGSQGMYAHASQRKRKKATKKAVVVEGKPSRRKPCGFYSILEVAVDATDSEIRAAYRRKSLLVHPDKVSGQAKSAATVKMAELNEAREVLLDPAARRRYDEAFDLRPPANSTPRVRLHRARLSKKERAISTAVEIARRKCLAKAQPRRKSRVPVDLEWKQSARIAVTARSTAIATDRTWTILSRPKRARRLDRRLGKYQAVPGPRRR